MTDDRVAADADVAVRYLAALLTRGVERADAVSLTASYMTSRAIVAGQQRPDPFPRSGISS
jgi:hypothetical protein